MLADPELISKPGKYRETAKNHAELQEIVEGYQRLKEIDRESASVKKMLEEEQDEELLSMARQELQELERQKSHSEDQLRVLLLPKDPNDEKNAILEIRAGTGGAEATLFAQEIFRMYTKYAERRGWKVEVLSSHPSPVGTFQTCRLPGLGLRLGGPQQRRAIRWSRSARIKRCLSIPVYSRSGSILRHTPGPPGRKWSPHE